MLRLDFVTRYPPTRQAPPTAAPTRLAWSQTPTPAEHAEVEVLAPAPDRLRRLGPAQPMVMADRWASAVGSLVVEGASADLVIWELADRRWGQGLADVPLDPSRRRYVDVATDVPGVTVGVQVGLRYVRDLRRLVLPVTGRGRVTAPLLGSLKVADTVGLVEVYVDDGQLVIRADSTPQSTSGRPLPSAYGLS
ncbi:MAG: hypothetical protein FWH11_06160 [Micrococcales bacterium]|nr:hypothetical protein [Micrococcales bacterium]